MSSPALLEGFPRLCFSTVRLSGLLYVLGSLCVMFCLVSTPLPMSPHYYSTSALLVVLLPYGFGHQLRVRERLSVTPALRYTDGCPALLDEEF